MPRVHGAPCFSPALAIEGDPKSPIWIVALNPRGDPPKADAPRPLVNTATWGEPNPRAKHFRRLRGLVGDDWHSELLMPEGIAHTDLVKCGSPGFDDAAKSAVDFCKDYLLAQVLEHRPRLLLVLSSDASRVVAEEAHMPAGATEGYWRTTGSSVNHDCLVLLSGYSSPRQDRFAKARLQKDFLRACVQVGLTAPKDRNAEYQSV